MLREAFLLEAVLRVELGSNQKSTLRRASAWTLFVPGPAQCAGRSRAREPVARKRRPLTLSKLGVRDRTRAVLKAFELQLV